MFILIIVACIWGTSFLLAKDLIAVVGANTGAFPRVFWGAFICLIIAAISEKWVFDKKKIAKAFIYGPLSIGLPFYFLFKGLVYVPSSMGALLNGLMPTFAIVMVVLKGRKINMPLAIMGNLIAIAGVFILVGDVNSFSKLVIGKELFLGITFLMLMNICYAAGNAFYDELHPKLPMFQSLFWILFSSSLCLFLLDGANLKMLTLIHSKTINAVVLGVVNTAIAFKLYYYIIEKHGAIMASQAPLIAPFAATTVSLAFGEITFSYSYMLALLFIVTAIKFSQMALRAKPTRFFKRFRIKVLRFISLIF